MTDNEATSADVMRAIGPLERHAIDTAPFDGLAQHYYALYMRRADDANEMQTALAAERDRAHRAEARLVQILEYAESTYTASTVARRIVQMGKATA